MASICQNGTKQSYKLLEEQPDHYTCLICLCVASEPYQLTCDCGRIYCKACLDEHFECFNCCPQCRRAVQRFPDARSKRQIDQLEVKCINEEKGCKWSGKLASLSEHCTDCEFRIVPCPNKCTLAGEQVMLLRKDMTTHTTTVCSNRLVDCPHCSLKVKHGELESVHFGKCNNFIVSCPNEDCTVKVERAELQMHRRSCEYEPVSCKYSYIGCPGRVVRKNKKMHEDNHQLHLDIAIDMISKLNLEKTDPQTQMKDATTQFKVSSTIQTHPPLTLVNPTSDTTFQTDPRDSVTIQSTARYGTVTTFKIVNFEQHRKTDEIYSSPPFYSHPGGYRLCVKVHSNGKSAGYGSYLSVAVHVMQGENDNTLAWPFNGEVTLELLNQDEDKYHHKKCMKFPTKPCEENSRTTRDDCNIAGFGYPKFISHHVLMHNISPSFLVRDTLFFRVSANATYSNSFKPWLTCTM